MTKRQAEKCMVIAHLIDMKSAFVTQQAEDRRRWECRVVGIGAFDPYENYGDALEVFVRLKLAARSSIKGRIGRVFECWVDGCPEDFSVGATPNEAVCAHALKIAELKAKEATP